MGGKIRFNVAKFGAKVASQVSKFGFGSGNNLPGYVFYKIAGKEALKDLAHEMSIGPINHRNQWKNYYNNSFN